jgi:hypothetical protein
MILEPFLRYKQLFFARNTPAFVVSIIVCVCVCVCVW